MSTHHLPGNPRQTESAELPALDPFRCEPLVLGRIADHSSLWTILLAPLFASLIVLANAVQGTLGQFPDGDGLRDVAYALHISTDPVESMTYPLSRDVVSLVLFIIIVATIYIVHKQWNQMHTLFPRLFTTGAFIPTTANIAVARDAVSSANGRFESVGRIAGAATMLTSVVVIALVLFGLREVGIFRILAPRADPSVVRDVFADDLYLNWWASLDSFPGWVAYGIIGVVGLYVIILQNVVGVLCINVIFALKKGNFKVGIDRYNRDGVAGWSALSELLTTVYLSLFLHAFALSLIIFIIGFEGIAWIVGLLVLWIVVTPIYTYFPLAFFGQGMRKARKQVIDDYIAGASPARDRITNVEPMVEQAIAAHVAGLRRIRVIPLRKSQILTGVFLLQLLPLVAAGLEIWLQLNRA